MSRSTKGKRVKQFQARIPQLDLSETMEVIHVHFKADDGQFYIYPPEQLNEVVQGNVDFHHSETYYNRDALRTDTLDGVMEAFEAICTKFRQVLREQEKEKVIRFLFKANTPTFHKSTNAAPPDIHFCESPAITLQFEVLWKVGNRLYRQPTPTSKLQDAGSAIPFDHDGFTIIDWTEDREAFFEAMTTGLTAMIDRVWEFVADLETNIDTAIEARTNFLLPPPGGDNDGE